jgi:cellulose synthase/poly-beta-1,6-N-acetylglucosamine synthase-like glycosyltransferase
VSLITIIFLCFAFAYLGVELWLTLAFYLYRNSILPEPSHWPEITILLAARNEEKNIGACLDSLLKLDYPTDKLHIIIGNDQSQDQTEEIAQQYAAKHAFITIVNIKEDGRGLKAKARVMAQMDTLAKGDFYLVTDADIRVKPQWAKFMIRHMKPETGVASGTTMVSGKGLYTMLQGIDWAHFMGMLNMISYAGVPATAVGNNMIIRKEAYWQTGGYGAIQFSITEDFKLYAEVCKQGWKWDNIMIPEVLAYSESTKGFMPLLHQRKRWLSGGRELPFYWWLLFAIFGAYYIFTPILLFVNPFLGLTILVSKMFLQFLSLIRIHHLLGEKAPNLLLHLIYELYLFAITISTTLFFIIPIKTIWKGRKY